MARLAVQGNTKREIGDQPFITRRTVEYNPRDTFRQIAVTSRAQLAQRRF